MKKTILSLVMSTVIMQSAHAADTPHIEEKTTKKSFVEKVIATGKKHKASLAVASLMCALIVCNRKKIIGLFLSAEEIKVLEQKLQMFYNCRSIIEQTIREQTDAKKRDSYQKSLNDVNKNITNLEKILWK